MGRDLELSTWESVRLLDFFSHPPEPLFPQMTSLNKQNLKVGGTQHAVDEKNSYWFLHT